MANDDVFSSPIYNPQKDDKVVELYKLMDSTKDQAVLDEYIYMFNTYPTHNPYQGVLYNPRTCDINAVVEVVDEIKNALKTRYDKIWIDGTPTLTHTPNQVQINALVEWLGTYPSIANDLETVSSVLSDFGDHTNRLISNMPSILGSIQQAIGNALAIGDMLGGNPCIPFADVFGSILQKGQDIIDQVMSKVQEAMSVVQNALSMVQQKISEVMGEITKVKDMMMNEVNKIAESLMSTVKMGLAELMSYLPDDPCIKSIMGNFMTTGANKILNKVGLQL